MGDKRYYWLKLPENYFDIDDTKIIESMPNGKDYIIFLLKLKLKSINTEGHLKYKDAIPYNEQMLSTITNTNIDIVRSAMKIFLNLGVIEMLDDGTIYMTQIQNMLGSESQSAERVRKFREQKSLLLQCNADVTNSNEHIDIDLDTDIETDKENIPYGDVVNYLNAKCGTGYKSSSKKTKELIRARWNEGFKLEDFKTVINKKTKEWLGTDQSKYLRPETIFGTKFESYLNQIDKGGVSGASSQADPYADKNFGF